MSLVALLSAKQLFDADDWRGCANRAYYAAYQAATSACIEHGDTFEHGWNNPSHEQLPGLIQNNGDLPVAMRRRVRQLLRILRNVRENADYRPGITVDRLEALAAVRSAALVLDLLGVTDEQTE
jgi:uncharacterized protein (UPF0332 family)